jgi:hypothetical protein
MSYETLSTRVSSLVRSTPGRSRETVVVPSEAVSLLPAWHRFLNLGLILVTALGAAIFLIAMVGSQQWGLDFRAYYFAGQNVAAGILPYTAAMVAGAIDAQGLDLYKYPPAFAQAMAPLGALSLDAAYAVFTAASAAILTGSLAFLFRRGGATWGAALLGSVALAASAPSIDAFVKGNVESLQVGLTALVLAGGLTGGAALAAHIILKITPVTLVPAILVSGRRAIVGLVAFGAAIVAVSFLAFPDAWTSYPTVLVNMMSGNNSVATGNLAPAAALNGWLGAGMSVFLRGGTLVAVAALVAASVILTKRPGGRPVGLLLATLAGFLLPGTLWLHYLVLLFPFVATGWARATGRERSVVLAGLALCSIPAAIVALAGTIVLGAILARILWAPPARSLAGLEADPA